MAFTRVKPGDWAVGEKLLSSQMNQLDTDHAKAVDGAGGGTYPLSAPIILQGPGGGTALQVTGDLEVTHAIQTGFLTASNDISADSIIASGNQTTSGTLNVGGIST